jgi:hypothetical protein
MPIIFDDFTGTTVEIIQNGRCFHPRGTTGSIGATLAHLEPKFDKVEDWGKGVVADRALRAFRAAGFSTELTTVFEGAERFSALAVRQSLIDNERAIVERRAVLSCIAGFTRTDPHDSLKDVA